MTVRTKTSELKFWGVIRGLIKDYYVFQGVKEGYKIIDEVGEGN
jgi:hypothetical protein